MSKTSTTSEINYGMRARRHFSAEQKLKIAEESLLPENTTSITARKYGIYPAQLYL